MFKFLKSLLPGARSKQSDEEKKKLQKHLLLVEGVTYEELKERAKTNEHAASVLHWYDSLNH